jgi:hypothetical protein
MGRAICKGTGGILGPHGGEWQSKVKNRDDPRTIPRCSRPAWSDPGRRGTASRHRRPNVTPVALTANAPNFCRYVRRVHVFRMEEWSDVTELLARRPAAPAPEAEEELEEQEDMALLTDTPEGRWLRARKVI